jgi:hypothetical protein
MILGSLIMVFGCLASFMATLNLLWPRVSLLEALFMAPGLGLSVSAWLALLLKSIPIMRKGVAPEVVVLTIFLQLLVIAYNWPGVYKKYRDGAPRYTREFRQHRHALWMLGAMSVWWYYMSYIHYLLPRGSEHITGGSVYADLPFHLNLTTSFLNGCNEWATVFSSLMSSFYAGVTLAYPFMPDFFISVLVAGGMTLRWALVLTSWVLLSSLFSLIYIFNYRVSGSPRVGMLSVWFTLFAGGLGAFYYAAERADWYTWDSLTNSAFQHGPDFVLYWSGGRSAYWFSLPAHILFPQRTVQHAYPLALSAMLCIWHGMMGCPPPDKDTKDGEEGAGALGAGAGGWELTGEEQVFEELRVMRRSSTGSVEAAGSGSGGGGEEGGSGSGSGSRGASTSFGDSSSTELEYSSGIGGSGVRLRAQTSGKGGSGSSSGGGAATSGRRAGEDVNGKKLAPVGGAGSPTAAGALASSTTPSTPTASSLKPAAAYFGFETQRCLFVFAGFLTGLIPLMQPHSYVSIGIIILIAAGLHTGTLALQALIWRGRAAQHLLSTVLLWTSYGLTAMSMGAPQFLKHFVHRVTFGVGTRGNGFVRWSAAWAEEGKGEGPVQTWWKALGIFVPCFLLALPLTRTLQQRALWAGYAVLFTVCNLVMFQPWHLDNTKLFYVYVFGASGYVALVLHRVLRLLSDAGGSVQGSTRLPACCKLPLRLLGYALALCACIALTFSGAMATWREMLNYAKLYDDIDFDLAEYIKETTPTDAIFLHDLTQANHIRVESSLAGRQVAHGFAGWLHSHGINSNQRQFELMGAINGEYDGVAALARHNITYITVDASSKNNFNYAFLDDTTDFVATNGKYSLYKVLPAVRSGAWQYKTCAIGGEAKKSDCLSAGCWHFGQGKCMDKPRKRKVEDCLYGKPSAATASPETCRSEGCVWVKDFPGPWCQRPGWGVPERIPQLRPGVGGSDCGWHNMNTQECVDKGCVWRTPPDP